MRTENDNNQGCGDLRRVWHPFDRKLFQVYPFLFDEQNRERKCYSEFIIFNQKTKFSCIFDLNQRNSNPPPSFVHTPECTEEFYILEESDFVTLHEGSKEIVVFQGLDFVMLEDLCWKFKINMKELISLN